MANVKITDLTAYADPVSTDVLPVVDVTADTTKKVSIATLLKNASLGTAALPGIAFDGDPNTGFYSPGADQVAISTAGTGRLFVSSAGFVGIGTSSPGSLLTSYPGNVSTLGAKASTGLLIDNNGSVGNISQIGLGYTFSSTYHPVVIAAVTNSGAGSTRADLVFAVRDLTTDVAPTERLRIASDGKVGIGTSSPNRLFESSAATVDNFARINTTGATKSGIEFANGGTVYSQLYFNNVAPYDLSLLQQYTTGSLILGTNNTEHARIDSSGRLLVGTSNQDIGGAVTGIKLAPGGQVFASSDTATLGLDNPFYGDRRNTAGDGPVYVLARHGYYKAAIGCTNGGGVANEGVLTFYTATNSGFNERMRIAGNGVVTVKNGAVAEIGTLTDAATITPDFAANCNFTVTLGGNRTIANPTNVTAGQSGSIFIVQDATGSRTASWGANWDWSSGAAPTLSTTANAIDRIDYVVRSATSIHAVWTGSYS